jgi:nucleoside-diphosphate-sugar epimerase
MQTILGSGGTIGTLLARELTAYTKEIRLVSRHPRKVNETDQLLSCDLINKDQVLNAVDGSEIAYLTVGLPYRTKIWQTTWPVIMDNVIAACKKHGCKLVFFDNMYMYDAGHLSFMTEDTPVNPPSAKGKMRAQIAARLMEEASNGQLQVLIARSADFYGPAMDQGSLLMEGVFKRYQQGKKANWLCSVQYKHSHTYTPDAAKGTAMLGNDQTAFQQIWHLPTAAEPPTGREWMEAVARELSIAPNYMVASRFVVRLMGLVNPIMREFVEMLYQYDRDYVFDSSKFNQHYNFQPTSYEQGIKAVLQAR